MDGASNKRDANVISQQAPFDIEKLVATCAAGMGEVRLGKLGDAELAKLAARLAPEAARDTRAEQLRAVLNAKRRHAPARARPRACCALLRGHAAVQRRGRVGGRMEQMG